VAPQELFGRKGPGTNRAWELTTWRPDTLIAELDSGILWSQETPEIVNKFFLNRGELKDAGLKLLREVVVGELGEIGRRECRPRRACHAFWSSCPSPQCWPACEH